MDFLAYATLISYLALNVDLSLQTLKIYKNKSSKDLSITGMSIRYIAILVILYKFFTLEDIPLIIGQGLITLIFFVYLSLAIKYRFYGKKR